ncbi:MAG: peptidoglycan DD-metalloendopeptidase family protein [Proteobacteria bacterium]|nr:peptidoglycan DD-metalloendopeptidase family protein [Pseudomonadota bacterium]
MRVDSPRSGGAFRLALRLAPVALALALGVPPAGAGSDQPEARRLQGLEHDLARSRDRSAALDAQAERLVRERATLRQRLVTSARRAQDYEETLAALDEALADLEAKAGEAAARLAARRAEHARLLFALQRLARNPAETFFLVPGEPAERLHGAVLLASAIDRIGAAARALKGETALLASLRGELSGQRRRMDEVRGALAAERTELRDLLAAKTRLQRETERERAGLAAERERLAAAATDLRDLIDRLAAAERVRAPAPPPAAGGPGTGRPPEAPAPAPPARVAPAAPAQVALRAAPAKPDAAAAPALGLKEAIGEAPARPFSEARGAVALPARGALVVRFGQSGENGRAARGLTIRTADEAQVVAPYDGRVVFGGPFRGYGLLLIIEHGEGYHTVLAGLARIDVVAGQWLLAGEPVGVMGRSQGEPPGLYVELRQDGHPINPLPWLTANKR